jgi:CheY-like chemotaxis protein
VSHTIVCRILLAHELVFCELLCLKISANGYVMIRDGLTCARLIRDYEDQGLLALPPPLSEPHKKVSTPSVSPIASFCDSNTTFENSQKRSLRLPILAVSANARVEQIQQTLAAGMDDAISKPFRIPELWPKIRGLIPRLADSQHWKQ